VEGVGHEAERGQSYTASRCRGAERGHRLLRRLPVGKADCLARDDGEEDDLSGDPVCLVGQSARVVAIMGPRDAHGKPPYLRSCSTSPFGGARWGGPSAVRPMVGPQSARVGRRPTGWQGG